VKQPRLAMPSRFFLMLALAGCINIPLASQTWVIRPDEGCAPASGPARRRFLPECPEPTPSPQPPSGPTATPAPGPADSPTPSPTPEPSASPAPSPTPIPTESPTPVPLLQPSDPPLIEV